MRSFVTAAVALSIAACAPAPIGDYPDEEGVKLPNRRSADDGDDTDGDEPNDRAPTPPATSTFKLTVTLGGDGTGAVTSTPGGLTCQGKTCTGTFVPGTSVTLVPTPAAGSIFAGWGGACTGTNSCAAVLDKDVDVTVDLESLAGTWSGTYTNTRQRSNCTFNNAGNMTITIAADGTTFSNTGSVTGLELRQLPSCNLVRTATGNSPKEAVTVAGNATSGTWTFNIPGVGSLDMPYTGAIAGKKLSGTWTCPTCVGSFTLTKQ
ncbi:MAG: hypothetical protein KF850_33945 [Labilithrix sp.]|nr:hypothetical protein [Labilithrix sp.]